jgi:hypothetical protein
MANREGQNGLKKRVDRPFILPPQRKSTGKSTPTLVRWIGDTWTGPLNDRLEFYLRKSPFPEESIEVEFKIEQRDKDLYFTFCANGETESFVLNDWQNVHRDPYSIEVIRALPWKLFQKIFQTLDRVKCTASFAEDNTFVNVYPNHMHPAPRGAHDLTYFPVFYWLVLPAWQHGKKVYKANCSYASWRNTVRGEIETKLSESPASNELITRSDDPVLNELVSRFEKPKSDNDVIELQARLRDRRIPAAAEELALDHAAHLCGVPLYEYTARHLKKLKSNSNTKSSSENRRRRIRVQGLQKAEEVFRMRGSKSENESGDSD